MKINPKAVAEHRDLVLNCLDDDDISIRLRALDLLEGMVTKRNIVDIVRKLLELSHTQGTKHGELIASQFMDVIIRVKVARPFGVKNMVTSSIGKKVHCLLNSFQVSLLRDITLLSDNPVEGGNCEVLYAAAW